MCVFATRMYTISVPASYCGVFGMRPTHGRVSLRGAVPLAESFDTPGLLARDIDMLASGMHALLRSEACSSGPNAPRFDGWKVARDCFDLADKSVASAIYDAVVSRKELWVGALGELSEISIGDDVTRKSSSSHTSSSVTPSTSIPSVGDLESWIDIFRILQAREVWLAHGDWAQHAMGEFGSGVRERFEMASKISPQEYALAASMREEIRAHVDGRIGKSVIVLPTAPTVAPLLGTPSSNLDELRRRTISLCSIASLCGLPQISLPLAMVKVDNGGQDGGAPVGVSLLGPRGSDEALLAAAQEIVMPYSSDLGED